jgi:glycosyltransferase involved in cell wall biosynthesis
MNSVKVLITTPALSLPGGVTGLYNLLQLDKRKEIEYFSVNFNDKKWSVLFLPIQFITFFFKVRNFNVVHLNPSMDAKSFYRDLVFCFISKSIFKRKTIVYWHGWQSVFFNSIQQSSLKTKLFQKTFGKAEYQIVLAKKFSQDLLSINYTGKIIIDSNVTQKITLLETKRKTISDKWNILFISRITKDKGWDIALKTFQVLGEKGINNVELTIAGDGDCILEAQQFVKNMKLDNVVFTGHVSGDQKNKLFLESDILFFPTCYPEGMPISILEGMMYGLPIISRNVGGIPDHITNNENGFLTDSTDPVKFANYIQNLITNQELYYQIKSRNIEKATIEFIPERLIKKLFELYN